jgi:FkbM family methyltransferase
VKGNRPIRVRWSHQHPLHRYVVRSANKLIRHVPPKLKYALALRHRRQRLPYALVPGSVVIHIGAPHDTLHSGRSRGFTFAMLIGDHGRLFVVEPNGESVSEFRRMLRRFHLHNTSVVCSGVWSRNGRLRIHVDPSHPATSFTEGTVAYPPDRLKDFRVEEVECQTIDSLVERFGLGRVDLLSITTNWAEREIIKGATRTLAEGTTFVSLAYGKGGESYDAEMQALGYLRLGVDDRGVTYRRDERVPAPVRDSAAGRAGDRVTRSRELPTQPRSNDGED